jgi:hypothetical protein
VRHVEAERLGGFEIDHQLVLGRRLHRKIGRLLALEDAINVAGGAPILVNAIRSITNQTTGEDAEAVGIDRGQLVPGCELDDRLSIT